jgi:hypothetical protein
MRIRSRLFLVVLGLFVAINGYTGNPVREVTVYKSPTCGCCNKWIEHLKKNGFKVEAHNVKDVKPYKIQNGVTPELSSCHTAIIDGYTIEGHVPASDIKRLLRERPKVDGLAVPGMPIGSPGMEQGNHKEKYNVISFDKKGNKKVFSSH